MTRETKIGLLVGLAFIIVVAILLSDPVNNANEPPPAVADTVGSVRQSLTVPASPAAPAAPAPTDRSTTTIITPNRAPSREPILTRTEAAEQTAQDEVHVGPAAGPLKPIIPQTPGNDDSSLAMQPGTPGQDNTVVTPTPPTPTPANPDDLHRAAIKGGEQLVPADTHDSKPAGTPDVPAPTGKHRYTAEAGDSVSKMAARFMGANTRANRAAIVAANASLKKDPNRVIVGEVYVIPAAASAAPADADTHSPAPTQVAAAPTEKKQPTRWYVVKPNDNLWRIATNELGDSGAVSEIISLNKDLLKNGKTLQPNMRLRLPPKAVASAD